MDPNFTVLRFLDCANGHKVEDETILNYHVPSPDLSVMDVPFVSPNPEPSTSTRLVSASSSKEALCSPNDDFESTDPVLKYITRILMEEDTENMPWAWEEKNARALRDTERALYQVLGEQCSPSVDQTYLIPNQILESSESSIAGSSKRIGSNGHSTSIPGASIRTGNLSVSDVEDRNLYLNNPTSNFSFQSTTLMGNKSDRLMVRTMFNDVESSLQFKRGYEEGCKFLPKIDLQSNIYAASFKVRISNGNVADGRNESEHSPDGSRGRKNLDQEKRDIEEKRCTKKLAMSVEESELSELFDKILLFKSKPAEDEAAMCGTSGTNKRPIASKGGKTRTKRQGKKVETLDLRDLLIRCACAVSSSDCRAAHELLKKIREHASPVGDGSQRLTHYFANGLEARMKGLGTRISNFYGYLASTKTTAADILRSYYVFFASLPYELPISFANKTICKIAEKANALHIVDFGILFGFQWPNLIELLSIRDGGPPKLRITGIELPQQGFRLAERVEETGRFLARYCERFNVPFEYNGMALQEWGSLRLEDLNIDSNEMLAVNNLYRFENLLDESEQAGVECPRNAVLRIIRSMKPDIFFHAVVNASFSGPFFDSRFREARLYYSSVFDVFDTHIGHKEPARLMFENGFYGHEIMNVVACEELERIYRPETYKQWQVRNIRAGFEPVPFERELIGKLRKKLKTRYHNDFAIEEDGHWMLEGWKGRILNAWSCWVPS